MENVRRQPRTTDAAGTRTNRKTPRAFEQRRRNRRPRAAGLAVPNRSRNSRKKRCQLPLGSRCHRLSPLISSRLYRGAWRRDRLARIFNSKVVFNTLEASVTHERTHLGYLAFPADSLGRLCHFKFAVGFRRALHNHDCCCERFCRLGADAIGFRLGRNDLSRGS